jgi:hypothetical protein
MRRTFRSYADRERHNCHGCWHAAGWMRREEPIEKLSVNFDRRRFLGARSLRLYLLARGRYVTTWVAPLLCSKRDHIRCGQVRRCDPSKGDRSKFGVTFKQRGCV